jgi:hypothetical protein
VCRCRFSDLNFFPSFKADDVVGMDGALGIDRRRQRLLRWLDRTSMRVAESFVNTNYQAGQISGTYRVFGDIR